MRIATREVVGIDNAPASCCDAAVQQNWNNMDAIYMVLIAGIVFAVAAVCIVGSSFSDKRRIAVAAMMRGWDVVSISVTPFILGWFVDFGARQYLVRYVDKNGADRRIYCRTDLQGRVYWAEDN